MEEIIEIKSGVTYIFKGKKASNDKTYNKFKILEVLSLLISEIMKS